MAFTPRSPAWANSPTTTTPLSAANLTDLETRVTNIGFGGLTTQAANGGSYTAVAGDVVFVNNASGGFTVNLPSLAVSTTVTIVTGANTSGTNQATISAGSNVFAGPGILLAGPTSFVLGAAGARVVLASGGGGTQWLLVSGEPDTGWILPSLTNSWVSTGLTTANYRIRGDMVYLRGAVKSGTAAATAFTVPGSVGATSGSLIYLCQDSVTGGATVNSVLIDSSAHVQPTTGTASHGADLSNIAWSFIN